jgi:hypothetical protein
MTLDPQTLRQAFKAAEDGPVHLTDPETNRGFVVIREEVYDRVKALFEETPLSKEEQLFFLREAGKRASWDDPAMDVYNDLDPRK